MKITLLGLLCFMLFGCSDKIDKSNVVGTYALNGDASDMLKLELTGTYHHISKGGDGRAIVAADTWELETVEGDLTVTLHNFKSAVAGINALGEGYFLLKVTRTGRKCRLWIGVDKSIYYEQTPQANQSTVKTSVPN